MSIRLRILKDWFPRGTSASLDGFTGVDPFEDTERASVICRPAAVMFSFTGVDPFEDTESTTYQPRQDMRHCQVSQVSIRLRILKVTRRTPYTDN